MNEVYALIALLSLVLLFRFWRSRRPTSETHPVGPTPIPPSPGADRLNYWAKLLMQLPPRDRLVAICELHRGGDIDTDTAVALIDEVA